MTALPLDPSLAPETTVVVLDGATPGVRPVVAERDRVRKLLLSRRQAILVELHSLEEFLGLPRSPTGRWINRDLPDGLVLEVEAFVGRQLTTDQRSDLRRRVSVLIHALSRRPDACGDDGP